MQASLADSVTNSGYDNGVLGGVIGQPAFKATFNDPDATLLGLIVSLYEVGCFFGAILCSIFGERLGRRKSICLGGVVMLIGAILQTTSYGSTQMIVARIVSGLGMGFINSTAPVYQSEFSPKASRGIWACAMLSTLNLGIFLAYWISYGFAGQVASYAWRVPVILQCIFIIPIIALSLFLPESPRWLVAHGQDDLALEVLQKTSWSQHHDHPSTTLENIQRAVIVEKVAQVGIFKSLFVKDGQYCFSPHTRDGSKMLMIHQRSKADDDCSSPVPFSSSSSWVASMESFVRMTAISNSISIAEIR